MYYYQYCFLAVVVDIITSAKKFAEVMFLVARACVRVCVCVKKLLMDFLQTLVSI